ncbi:MAG TPA: hypothetical protein VHA75_06195 [Rugosimonospora sp.]|nr:hypothetical protein [Rugosimonospora sp.]
MRRRIVAVAVAGLLAVAGLAGCRAELGSAAYVGDTRITTDQVDSIFDEAKADGWQVDAASEPSLRQSVVSFLVLRETAKRYTEEKGYPTPTFDYQPAAANLSLPTSDPIVRLVTEVVAYLALLQDKVPPAALGPADYTAVAQQVVDAGSPGDVATVAAQLQLAAADQIARTVAVRDVLAGALRQYHVMISPRYAPGSITLAETPVGLPNVQAGLPMVVLPLTANATLAPAVTNLPGLG